MSDYSTYNLRTRVRIQYRIISGSGVHKTTAWFDLDGTPAEDHPKSCIWCDWYPLSGVETWAAQVVDAANVVIRYNPAVTSMCRLVKDGIIYRIIGPNDPDQHHQWLKFKAKAVVNGE